MSSASVTIVESARLCAQSFLRIQSTPSRNWWSKREFEDQLGRFKLWSGSLGVFAADTASLDFRLKDDQDVKDVLINMVTSLREQVELLDRPSPLLALLEEQREDETEPKSSGSPVSSTASSSSWKLSSNSGSATNMENVPSDLHRRYGGLSQITDIVNRLYRLSTVIRKPISLSEHARVAQYIEKTKHELDTEDFESYVKWQIERWCPTATLKLINRLAGAVVYRRKKLLWYRERPQEKLNEGTEGWIITQNSESVCPESNKIQVQDTGSLQILPARVSRSIKYSASQASSIDIKAVPAYEGSFALSRITKSAIARRQQLDIPAPPKPKSGWEAKCPYCFKFLTEDQLKKAHWTRHILQDIDPYICLFEECDEPDNSFKSVDDWLSHIQWRHTLFFSCQSVGHESELFSSRTGLEQHMKREHSGEFTETQLAFLVSKSAKPSRDIFLAFANARKSIDASMGPKNLCPLCPFSPEDVDIPSPSINLVSHDTRPEDRKFKITLDHITNHMESIALLSLPAVERLEYGISDELKSQSGEDIEQDDRYLPSADFVDEPSSEIVLTGGSSGEDLPIHDYVLKEGWGYVLDSPNVLKTKHLKPGLDEQLINFMAPFLSERIGEPLVPFSTVPFRRDPDFVERGDILHQIDTKLSLPASRVALVGLGGVGKSNLAIEYSYRVRECFPQTWIFWVHASNATRFEEGYRMIADNIKLPRRDEPAANILQLVSEWLCDKANERWMMVLDNADDSTLFSRVHNGGATSEIGAAVSLSTFLPHSPNGSILVTSRSRDAALRLIGSHQDIIKVEPMDEHCALLLFEKKLRGGFDKYGAIELIRTLDYIPFAISQAATYISQRAPRVTVAKYLDVYRKSDRVGAVLLDKDAGDLRRDTTSSNSIITTLQISFDYIREKMPSAARLLSLMSFFDRQGIPEFLLHHYDDREDDISSDLDGKTAVDVYDLTFEEENDITFEEDLFTLTSFSLVTSNVKNDQFEMHRLVQSSVRKWLELNGELSKWTMRYIIIILNAFPEGDYKNWTLCQRLFSHVEAMLAYRPRERKPRADRSEVLNKAGRYAALRGNYSTAEEMFREAIAERTETLGLKHLDTLRSISNLTEVLLQQGDYEEAEQMSRRELDENEKAFGKEHPNTMTSVSNLALTLQKQGKYNAAEQMSRRALKEMEKILGKKHPDTLTSVRTLALVLLQQEKYEAAQEMFRLALDGNEKMLGREHLDTLKSAYFVAYTMHRQMQYRDAVPLYEITCTGLQKVLGTNHPTTLSCSKSYASMIEEMKEANQSSYLPELKQMSWSINTLDVAAVLPNLDGVIGSQIESHKRRRKNSSPTKSRKLYSLPELR